MGNCRSSCAKLYIEWGNEMHLTYLPTSGFLQSKQMSPVCFSDWFRVCACQAKEVGIGTTCTEYGTGRRLAGKFGRDSVSIECQRTIGLLTYGVREEPLFSINQSFD